MKTNEWKKNNAAILRKFKLEKPKRYYNRKTEYAALEIASFSTIPYVEKFLLKKMEKGDYPCYYCKCEKKLYNSNDNDPIEGYKMASRTMNCPLCNGEGYVSKKTFTKWHKVIEAEYKSKLQSYKKIKKRLEGILEQLSDDDILMLEQHFNPNMFFSYDI